MRADLETSLQDRVRPSSVEGDDPTEGCNRIQRGVRDFRAEHLGRDVDGRRVGGLYRIALDQCMTIHRDRYRLLLREHLLHLLNGPDPTNRDYQHEKRGKLGQAQALLTQLARYFADLSALLGQVKAFRAARDELRSAQEEASLARLEMEAKKGKKGSLGIFVKNLQPAVQAQRAYIDAERHVIDIEVKDLFFDVLQLTSDILRAVTEEHKATVETWIAALVRGQTGLLADPGLHAYLRNGAAQHAAHRQEKRRIAVHEYLTDDAYEARLYQNVSEGKFAEALTRLVWEAEPQRDNFQLLLSGCSPVTAAADGRSATDRNAKYLLGIARDFCAPLRDLTIAERLIEYDVQRLAEMLLDRCDPLIRYDSAKTGGEQELRYFICVNEGRQKAYFNEFRAVLKRLGASARDNQILHSANPYTCTILATADVIASAGLHAFAGAEREYNNYPGDARLLHCFPAEVNAVQLEQMLPRIREPRRRFSHVLTAMLEDRALVDLFILAFAYRFIRLEEAGGVNGNRWMLNLTNAQRTGEEQIALTGADRRPSLYDAMECFVFHQADIANPTHKIDFATLEQELRRYESQASGGDESRLINLLEAVTDSSVEPLRNSPDPALHDIGSVMRLVVDEIVQGLFERLRAARRNYDPNAAPLQQPAPRAALAVSLNGTGAHKGVAAMAEVLTVDAGEPLGAREKLKELKHLLEEGLIGLTEYESKRTEILSRL